MKKRILMTLLVFCLLASACMPAVRATEPEQGNSCGENLTWELDGDTLTISGSGRMDDFYDGAPWQTHKDSITTVVLEGVTYIGACAFKNYDNLSWVDFGDALTEIGEGAFQSCDGLTSITLPASFKIFGESSFQSCRNLTEIHCNGKFPSFRQNCLWDTYVTISYPVKNNWSVTYIAQMEEAFHGRVEFLASDGTDPYVPTEPETEPETEPVTEPETEPTEVTEPATEPTEPTEATEPTEEATEPAEETTSETEEPTDPALIAPNPNAPSDEETEDPAETGPAKEFGSSGGKIGLVIVAVILCVLALGAIIFRPRKKGKYARRGKKKKGGSGRR